MTYEITTTRYWCKKKKARRMSFILHCIQLPFVKWYSLGAWLSMANWAQILSE